MIVECVFGYLQKLSTLPPQKKAGKILEFFGLIWIRLLRQRYFWRVPNF